MDLKDKIAVDNFIEFLDQRGYNFEVIDGIKKILKLEGGKKSEKRFKK